MTWQQRIARDVARLLRRPDVVVWALVLAALGAAVVRVLLADVP